MSVEAKKQPKMKMGNTTSASVLQAITWHKPEYRELLMKFKELCSIMGQDSLYSQMSFVSQYATPIKALAS